MTDQVQEIVIDNINTMTKTISIRKQTIFVDNGAEVARSEPWRRAFVPGEIEAVKEVTGWNDSTPEVIYLNSIWTQEVIDAYNAMIAAQNAALEQ